MERPRPADRVPDDTSPDALRDAGVPSGVTDSDADPVRDPDVPPAGRATGGERKDEPVVEVQTRAERSPKDMAFSLLVLLIPIALILGFYRIVLGGDEPVVVDPAPAVAEARAANAFPVSEPVGLASGWRPVTASFRQVDGGQTLRIGYVSPEGDGAQLIQSNVPPERLVPAELRGSGQPQGRTELAGRSWQRYAARAGEHALVLLEPARTVIVVGGATEEELRVLAGKLS